MSSHVHIKYLRPAAGGEGVVGGFTSEEDDMLVTAGTHQFQAAFVATRFVARSYYVSSRVSSDQNRYFEPKHDVFLTLTRFFFS